MFNNINFHQLDEYIGETSADGYATYNFPRSKNQDIVFIEKGGEKLVSKKKSEPLK